MVPSAFRIAALLAVASQTLVAAQTTVTTEFVATVTCPPVIYVGGPDGPYTETNICNGFPTPTTATVTYTIGASNGTRPSSNVTTTHTPTTALPTFTAGAGPATPLPTLAAAVLGAMGAMAAML